MKKALVVIAVLLALGGGIFFFLKTVSPEPKGTVLKNRPAHLRNVEKGTVFKARKRWPRPRRRDVPPKKETQNRDKR